MSGSTHDSQQAVAGAALRAALEERGCALEAHEARALADALIDLICSGVIVADTPQTAPAYNMGSLFAFEGSEHDS
ncbi:MAG: hypothetical protein EG823_00250 [Actinobacteria bacterium]|nr:hypothetical protein [Actinomycetota bacterium]